MPRTQAAGLHRDPAESAGMDPERPQPGREARVLPIGMPNPNGQVGNLGLFNQDEDAIVAILAALSDGFTKPNPDLYQPGLQARQALPEGSPG
jgi:hypothetical protein